MASLRYLELSSCPKPEYLSLTDSNIIEIPASIKDLSKLRMLYINNCKNLHSLPDPPFSLEILNANGCVSLEAVSNAKRSLTQDFWDCVPISLGPLDFGSIFFDCLKLDQNEQENILIEFQLRVSCIAMQFKVF